MSTGVAIIWVIVAFVIGWLSGAVPFIIINHKEQND